MYLRYLDGEKGVLEWAEAAAAHATTVGIGSCVIVARRSQLTASKSAVEAQSSYSNVEWEVSGAS